MLLPQGDWQTKAVESWWLLRRQLSAHQLTIGTALYRGAKAGSSQVLGMGAALHQLRGP